MGAEFKACRLMYGYSNSLGLDDGWMFASVG